VRVIAAVHQSHHNKALAELLMKNIELVGMPDWSENEHEFAKALQRRMGGKEQGMPTKIGKLKGPAAVFTGGASSDHGDVTLVAPTATIRFPGSVGGARTRSSLVHGGLWTGFDCLEGAQRRRQGHGFIGYRPADRA